MNFQRHCGRSEEALVIFSRTISVNELETRHLVYYNLGGEE